MNIFRWLIQEPTGLPQKFIIIWGRGVALPMETTQLPRIVDLITRLGGALNPYKLRSNAGIRFHSVNSFDKGALLCAIWRHKSGSAFTEVMSCCLTASSHYLNQCWLIIINWILWQWYKNTFTGSTPDINSWNTYERYRCAITCTSLSTAHGEWVNT